MQPLLGPIELTPVVPQRPTDDGMGNIAWTDLAAVNVLFWLGSRGSGTRSVTLGGERGPTWTEFGQVFIPRGYDIKSGDRIPYQGLLYVISGKPSGDQLHPFTGHDFGWMSFNVEGHQ
jgi:hypothetical protein